MTTTTTARAWAITRGDGLTLGFTDHDGELQFQGISFRPDSGMTASALVQGTGLSVDNSEAEGALTDDAITERDLLAGRWDGAMLEMWEVDWRNVVKRTLTFRGTLGEVSRGSGAFRAELRGLSEPLNASMGRVYHPLCAARLGDGKCGVGLGGPEWTHEAQIEALEHGRIFRFASFPAYDTTWFERGTLHVLSGDAKGLSATIKNDIASPNGGREIELWQELGLMPAIGDRLRLVAGCDKRSVTCKAKFRNYQNFRGFPHLPSEDWLLAPHVGSGND